MNTDEMRRLLELLRHELVAGEARTSGDRRPVALDQQSVGRLSRMDALQMQAMANAQAGRREAQLKRIEAALERMEAGEFGYCITCGEPIGLKRLEHDPTVPTCISCARA